MQASKQMRYRIVEALKHKKYLKQHRPSIRRYKSITRTSNQTEHSLSPEDATKISHLQGHQFKRINQMEYQVFNAEDATNTHVYIRIPIQMEQSMEATSIPNPAHFEALQLSNIPAHSDVMFLVTTFEMHKSLRFCYMPSEISTCYLLQTKCDFLMVRNFSNSKNNNNKH